MSWKDHAYNWFLMAPPNDLFIRRVRDCAWQFLDSVGVSGSAWKGIDIINSNNIPI